MNNEMINKFYICIIPFILISYAGAEQISVTVKSDDYLIINEHGYHTIEMENSGYRLKPGDPMLPSRTYIIGIPPGSKAESVRVEGLHREMLPRHYHIAPVPPVLPLLKPVDSPELFSDLQSRWEIDRNSVYSSDKLFPEVVGELVSSGTLRKYSYVSVSISPFSYNPVSGRLFFYNSARINIEYKIFDPPELSSLCTESLMRDTAADSTAADILYNFNEIKHLYKFSVPHYSQKSSSHDYIIITTPDLAAAINSSDFIDWKSDLGYGMKMVLTTDSEIAGQSGIDCAERIRNFLREYYITWRINYVLLIGDTTSIPMRYCHPDPNNHSFDPGNVTATIGEVPTDYYYADLSYPDNLSWDSDADGYYGEYGQDEPDFLAEVYVGRIPTSDTSRITQTLNKLVKYEQDTGIWKSNVLHAGAILFFENQDHSGIQFRDGAFVLNKIEKNIMSGFSITHYSEQAGLKPSECTWNSLNANALINEWRTGCYSLVNWAGHGWSDRVGAMIWGWDDGDTVPESSGPSEISWYDFMHTRANLDCDYPSVVFAVSCHVGYPENNSYGRLGVDLLTSPTYGSAAAVISSTRIAWVHKDFVLSRLYPVPPGAEAHCYEFNRFMVNGPDGKDKLGDALYKSKFFCDINYRWLHYAHNQNMFNYNLYGDPSMVREGVNPLDVPVMSANGVFFLLFIVSLLYLHPHHALSFSKKTQ